MNVLNELYDYINEETVKFFGKTETYNFIDPSKWFLIRFPYVLKNARKEEILLSINYEIHSHIINGVICYIANLDFSINFSEEEEMFTPCKNKDFAIKMDKDNSTILYSYKWQNELNTDDSDVIIMNEHFLEIIDKFLIDLEFYSKNDIFLKQYSFPKEITLENDRTNILQILRKYNLNPTTLYKAYDYYKMNRIVSFEHEKCEDFDYIRGNVVGHNSNVYNAFVKYKNNTLLEYRCQCLAYKNYSGPCKHIICLLFKVFD
jgi:hypothetical protein